MIQIDIKDFEATLAKGYGYVCFMGGTSGTIKNEILVGIGDKIFLMTEEEYNSSDTRTQLEQDSKTYMDGLI